jgi:hypothetical protein
MAGIPYLAAIGSLQFLAGNTRPDLAHALGVLGQFSSNPGMAHWKAVQRCLKYVVGTLNYRLCYGGPETPPTSSILGYTDADWGGDVDSRRSRSGYAFFCFGGLVSFKSKLQQVQALSSTEAEYYALVEGGKEAMYLTTFLKELGYAYNDAKLLRVDNQSAIAIAKNDEHRPRTKHVDIKWHWIRDRIAGKTLQLEYVPTAEQVADIFTKQLQPRQHQYLCKRLGLVAIDVAFMATSN